MAKKTAIQDRWIWPFELLEKIGEGAMGVVYRARSVTNNREVALKLLPGEFASDETLAARFEREMDVLKTLKHPHIVHSYGGVCEGRRRFYAMELVEGGSLYHLIKKRGPMSWKRAVDYARQMCAGLGFAHQHGVVHRDVKPSNFLLTKDGKLKLSDFGLAHVSSATKLTAAGKTMGTYQYMAPEQIRGSADISPQTDLYAMGCVIFEMLTGRSPFTGDSPAEILQQHLEAVPPRVSEFALDCPDPALADMIVAKLLEKSVKKRPANAEAVAEWLESSVESTAGTARKNKADVDAHKVIAMPKRVGTWRRLLKLDRKWMLPACAILLVAMIVWNLALLSRGGSSPVPRPESLQAEQLWIDAISSKQVPVRVAACEALGRLGRQSDAAVTALISGLGDVNPGVRLATVSSLSELGSRAQPALSALLKMQQRDVDSSLRHLAGDAVTRIRAETEKTAL